SGAEHAIHAIAVAVRRAVLRRMRTIRFVAILGPLEDVAVHVVKAERVRRERPDRRRLVEPHVAPFGLAAESALHVRAEVAVIVVELVAPRERRRRAGSRSVLPL